MDIEKEMCERISREKEEQKDDFCYIKINRKMYNALENAGYLIRDIFRFSIKFTIMYLLFEYVLHL